ncbi:MAG: YraN family protein [Patescibacteria group bacterium]
MRRRQALGQWGERVAAWWLAGHGYTIVGRNYRCRGGEVDIIARQAGQLAFFEVKTRRTVEFGYPEEAFGRLKQHRFQKAVDHYLASRAPNASVWQIGLVAITKTAAGGALVRLIWY